MIHFTTIKQLGNSSKWCLRIFSSILFLFFSCHSIDKEYYSNNTPEIILNMHSNQIGAIYDNGIAGLSQFSRLMRSAGYAVSMNYEPLYQAVPLFSDAKILVLLPEYFQSYSSRDIVALFGFVEAGGSILIVTEHDNAFKITEQQNQLLVPLGAKAMGWRVVDNRNAEAMPNGFVDIIWPSQDSTFLGVENFRLLFSAPLFYSDEWLVLCDSPTISQGMNGSIGVRDFGEGRVGVISDFEIFWNLAFESSFPENNNRELLISFFKYLDSSDGVEFVDVNLQSLDNKLSLNKNLSTPNFEKQALLVFDHKLDKAGIGGFEKLQLFLNDDPGLVVQCASAAQVSKELVLLNDAVIFWPTVDLNPLFKTNLTEQDAIGELSVDTFLSNIDKFIFISDRQTAVAQKSGDLFYDTLKSLEIYQESSLKYRSPLFPFEKDLGFQLLPVTLIGSHSPPFQFKEFKGASLFNIDIELFSEGQVFYSDEQQWAVRRMVPPVGLSDSEQLFGSYRYPLSANNHYATKVVGEKVFLYSDIEPFTNLYLNSTTQYRKLASDLKAFLLN